jgi:hypothetical protein
MILALLLAASAPINLPAGGSSGPAYGVSVMDDTGSGRMNDVDMAHQGVTAVVYSFDRAGWAALFPMGWKPAEPYAISPRASKRIGKAARDWYREAHR